MLNSDPVLALLSSESYLGFDFGNKKIGVAVGQLSTKIASPLETLKSLNQVPHWQKISQLVNEWQPIGFIVGVSRQHDGRDNIITPRMLKFCRQLNGRYNLPVFQVDEALSTFAAKQMLYDDLQVNASKLWQVQDQLAAQLILQSWFNQQT